MANNKAQSFLDNLKKKITAGDIKAAENDLHYLIVNRDFDNMWGAGALPVMWKYIAHFKLSTKDPFGGPLPTAAVDLRNGEVRVNPNFLVEKVHSLADLLFIVMHERDHRLLRRLYRVDWSKMRRILNFNEEWIANVRNVMEDAWINASVRTELKIDANLPEQFYCWSQEDANNPGIPSEENPKGSGFDPAEHKVGEPKSEEYALLTCFSNFVERDIKSNHVGLYRTAYSLLTKHGMRNPQDPVPSSGHYRTHMLSFPEWYDAFCDWLNKHKDDLALPPPGCNGDKDCPVHGKSSKSNEECDGSEQCTCRGGKGLLGEPMSLAERLARLPSILLDQNDIEETLDDGADHRKKGERPEPTEVFTGGGGQGASWGGYVRPQEIIAKEVQDLNEVDRELMEMGGSHLTESFRTNTARVKGAVKQFADEMVQNIATMRVTEHKIIRPDFNIPPKISKRDLIRMGMGDAPLMWDTAQYLEQNELVVYTDVSGSMNWWYAIALYITQQLREYGCQMYQFSTVVAKPVPERDDNIFWTDGGTDFDTVCEHIALNGFKAVVIITDNQDNIHTKWMDPMKELPELYAIFLENRARPSSYDPKTFAFGGNYGRNGWQKVTDKITGIFRSDVEN